MTSQRVKGKNQQSVHRHQDSIFLSPKAKLSSNQKHPISSHHDLHSHSKSKHKLKMHIFKTKNVNNQEQLQTPIHKQTIKTYSSVGKLPQEGEKPKFNARQFLAERKALLTPKSKRVKQKKEPEKKERKQFKLIHEIKREKASKLHEKVKLALKPIHLEESKTTIEAASHKKMDNFVEELHQILSPKIKPQRSSIEQFFRAEEIREEPVIEVVKEQIKICQPQNSVVKMNLPSQLLISEQYSEVKEKKIVQEEERALDLNRSIHLASKILKQRKDSASSMEISLRGSKVRAQISISLALESNQGSRIDLSAFYKDLQIKKTLHEPVTCRQKVNAHLQILQSISTFVYESTKFDEIGDEWQQLNFLIYKKFYIERRKVLNFIQKYPMRNPFCVYNSEIKSKEIIQFMKTEEGISLVSQLKVETAQVKEKLTKIYSKFDKRKVGEKINLYQYDNFSHWIIQQLWAELILTEHNTVHSKEEIKVRLCRILQLIFLISELNGKYQCSFEDAEIAITEGDHQSYIQEGKQIFQRYILYKNGDKVQ